MNYNKTDKDGVNFSIYSELDGLFQMEIEDGKKSAVVFLTYNDMIDLMRWFKYSQHTEMADIYKLIDLPKDIWNVIKNKDK